MTLVSTWKIRMLTGMLTEKARLRRPQLGTKTPSAAGLEVMCFILCQKFFFSFCPSSETETEINVVKEISQQPNIQDVGKGIAGYFHSALQ